MKLKLKQEKGITLIALVITIIILLILAGVSIAMLTGDNGILNQAQTAKEKTERAGVIERVQTEIVSKQVENGKSTLSKTELKQILDSYFDGVPDNYDLNTSLQTKAQYGDYQINVSEIYNGSFREEDSTTIVASNIPASDYGAKVKGYDCINNEGVTSWNLFYADDNNIYLIADNFIPYNYCPPSENYKIYKNGSEYHLSLNEVYQDYKGTVDIKDEKIKNLNNDYFNVKKITSGEINIKAVAYMLDTDVWSVYAGDKAEYAIGGPTIELFFKSYNKKYGTQYVAEAVSEKGYLVGDGSGNATEWELKLKVPDDPLYIKTSESGPLATWLASPAATSTDLLVNVNYKGEVCHNYYGDGNPGFRPLVCLAPNTKLQKNDDGSYTIL